MGEAFCAEKRMYDWEKRLFAKSAGSISGSKHAVFNAELELPDVIRMVPAWDSVQKHRMNR